MSKISLCLFVPVAALFLSAVGCEANTGESSASGSNAIVAAATKIEFPDGEGYVDIAAAANEEIAEAAFVAVGVTPASEQQLVADAQYAGSKFASRFPNAAVSVVAYGYNGSELYGVLKFTY